MSEFEGATRGSSEEMSAGRVGVGEEVALRCDVGMLGVVFIKTRGDCGFRRLFLENDEEADEADALEMGEMLPLLPSIIGASAGVSPEDNIPLLPTSDEASRPELLLKLPMRTIRPLPLPPKEEEVF